MDTLPLLLQLKQVIKGNYSNFSVDNLGNIYLVTTRNQIKKLNSKLDSVAIFNESQRFGNIYTIDVSNPMKVLVYYKDYSTILILDQQLNPRNTIDLREQNLLQVNAIAQSYDNQIWLFDEIDNKLKKIDDAGLSKLETLDFRLQFKEVFVPYHIIDNNGLLYLYNKHYGWKVFDYYGALKQSLPAKGWLDVQVNGNKFSGHDSAVYIESNFWDTTKTLYRFENAPYQVKKIIKKPPFFYSLTQDGLGIYEAY